MLGKVCNLWFRSGSIAAGNIQLHPSVVSSFLRYILALERHESPSPVDLAMSCCSDMQMGAFHDLVGG